MKQSVRDRVDKRRKVRSPQLRLETARNLRAAGVVGANGRKDRAVKHQVSLRLKPATRNPLLTLPDKDKGSKSG